MIDMYELYNSSILGVQEVAWENVNKYGIVLGDKVNDKIYFALKRDDLKDNFKSFLKKLNLK